LERLNQQLSEVQTQLLAAWEDLRETESEREELERELGKLEFQSLFAREYLRLQHSLSSASARAEDSSDKIAMLEQRRKQSIEQVEARSEQLTESIALLQKDAQIASSFSGEILRIERKPENKTVVYSVFYRESPDHQ
jgi:septal ring factor EnvC (AmiA/AmiB activator)